MDPSVSPWRVIDGPSPESRTAAKPPVEGESGAATNRPSLSVVLGLAGAALLAAAGFAFGLLGTDPSIEVDGPSAAASGLAVHVPSSPGPSDTIVVEVAGAVLQPGVYRLPPGSRVGDGVTAAGGYGPRVAAERASRELNLAAILSDGDRIVVPSRDDPSEEPAVVGGGPGDGSAGRELIDVNRASASELDTLPGIGPATAAKIIAAREEQPFGSIDELRTRKVVGQATFEKIRALVTVR